jgi:hypothetical protein
MLMRGGGSSKRDLPAFHLGFGQMIAPPDAYPILTAAREQQLGMHAARPRTG